MQKMWSDFQHGNMGKILGVTEAESLKMQMAKLKREQGRKIQYNLLDIIQSLTKKLVSKNPEVIQRIHENRKAELKSILGEPKEEDLYDVNEGREEDGQSAQVHFSIEDTKHFKEFPELLDNDKFF